MKLQYLLVSGCFMLSPEIIPGPSADREIETVTGWQLERNNSGVKTYVRWVDAGAAAKVRERKSVMEVNCSADEVLRILSDVERTDLWMGGIRESYCLKRISPSEWYAYTLFDIPWPFEKRDLVSNFRVEKPGRNNSIIIHITSQDRYIPRKDHVTRLADYTATWIITGIGEDKAYVSFSAVSNDPPMFPRAIQDPVVLRMFHNNLVNLKKMLEI